MTKEAPAVKQIPKRISPFSSALALYTVDFPIFYVESISERHVVIAGGGGSSKTGVHNQIHVLELHPTEGACSAESVMEYQTPDEIPDAIMTGSLMRDRPIGDTRVISGGTQTTIYCFRYDSTQGTFHVSHYEALEDSKTRAEVKTVRYTSGRILTGGMDGYLTCWNVANDNNKRVELELQAHSKEIDDIDVDTVNQVIATLSRAEGRLVTWNLKNLKKLGEISSKSINKSNGPTNSVNYFFRSCRYAYDTTSQSIRPKDVCLLVACNPVPTKSNSSKLCKWQTADDDELKLIATGFPSCLDSIMAMTVSLDGKYVAVGSRSGGVGVLEVKSLRNIYTVEGAHHNAITGLEFLPPKPESLIMTNSKANPLLSVAIDRRVVLHRPKTQPPSMWLIKTIFMLIVIYVLVYILHKYYDVTSLLRPNWLVEK